MIYHTTYNTTKAVLLNDIPVVEYAEFYTDVCDKLHSGSFHIAHYFAVPEMETHLRFFCLLLDDTTSQVLITSFTIGYYDDLPLPSLTAKHPQVHIFEREITELYGVKFEPMPWDKPLRYPFNRANRANTIDNYPFYTMEGGALHEVNVGPIHAGIIEPGAFRFICNGENVLHLEIALGYQHRGVEHLITATHNSLRQTLLAESIAGDSTIAHTTAFVEMVEKLSSMPIIKNADLQRGRAIALELERVAMHIADTGALCTDVAYQLGQVACEALRTITINTMQAWCGNRFGKGVIRTFGTNHPLTTEKIALIRQNIADVCRRYKQVCEDIKSSPTILARFEQCGIVPREQMLRIGGVGQAARASGVPRDIRTTHPWGVFQSDLSHEIWTTNQGDVMARLVTRCHEVMQSAEYIGRLLNMLVPSNCQSPRYDTSLTPEALSFGMVEGWRGEICHVAITDAQGLLSTYKIKDPSLHNWPALALSVRSEGISDFPICNKSFNLSYCGHDL